MDELLPLLGASRAHPTFKAAVEAYLSAAPTSRVVAARRAPRVKVARVIAQLLHAEPALAIEAVAVDGVSGCCDFRGVVNVVVGGRERAWEFTWDCRWRARESGYVDIMGWPDQARAAREFGWQCFSAWHERTHVGSAGEHATQLGAAEPCA